jgi:hypothetical protein
LLSRRIGTSAFLSLLQPPSLLPLLHDCYHPSTLNGESAQKKKKAEKVYFYLWHNKLKKANIGQVFSESRSGKIAHKKIKITAVTH